MPPERAEMQMTDESVMPRPPRPLTVKAFGITDKEKVRTTNEDQFLIAELTKAMRVWQTSLRSRRCRLARSTHICFSWPMAWAGTGRAKERPRRGRDRAVHAQYVQVVLWLEWPRSAERPRAVPVRAGQADARILEEAAEHPELSGMGTTVTMAFHLGAQLCVVHVGDSRASWTRDGELHQLTKTTR